MRVPDHDNSARRLAVASLASHRTRRLHVPPTRWFPIILQRCCRRKGYSAAARRPATGPASGIREAGCVMSKLTALTFKVGELRLYSDCCLIRRPV